MKGIEGVIKKFEKFMALFGYAEESSWWLKFSEFIKNPALTFQIPCFFNTNYVKNTNSLNFITFFQKYDVSKLAIKPFLQRKWPYGSFWEPNI